jgi:2-oxoglutarate ferredoxin oxidoreductase subunit alpha
LSETKKQRKTIELDSVVIRFAGDSGDGMQVTGAQAAEQIAHFGNDLATLPDYPAEIRAPAGSLGGVSAYQVHFSSSDIHTPGDTLDALVVMNAAALKMNIEDLKVGGFLLADSDGFDQRSLELAGYATNPLSDGSLANYRVVQDDFTAHTVNAVKDLGVSGQDGKRCKNFFTLGMVFWLFDRELDYTEKWLKGKYTKKPQVADANIAALRAGHSYADTLEIFAESFAVRKAPLPPGTYRNVNGNEAVALGLTAGAEIAGRPLVFCSYPITPATEILQYAATYRRHDVRVYQAEDEIAAVTAAIGGSFAGGLGVTTTSGPGLALKTEGINLAVMTELPLVVVDVQRGGPSTGLPTKTEQSDLLEAMWGRNGDSPIVVLAAASPADCFTMALESARIAIEHMTPVILLTDGYIANGSEPFRIPTDAELPKIAIKPLPATDQFQPYARDPQTLARPWAWPGVAGYEHRIGGLEKKPLTGAVTYAPDDHQKMTDERFAKIAAVADNIPEQALIGELTDELLVVSWGGTYGAVRTAVEQMRKAGQKVALAHVRYINPFPHNFKKILSSFGRIIIPEINNGQLSTMLSARYAITGESFSKVEGRPFKVSELVEAFTAALAQPRSK